MPDMIYSLNVGHCLEKGTFLKHDGRSKNTTCQLALTFVGCGPGQRGTALIRHTSPPSVFPLVSPGPFTVSTARLRRARRGHRTTGSSRGPTLLPAVRTPPGSGLPKPGESAPRRTA